MATRAVVLLSGGIDSAVALWWARSKGWEVLPVTFDYRHRPVRERQATERLAARAGAEPLVRVPVPFLAEVPELDPALLANPRLSAAPAGYIPARNLVFYAIAFHYAEVAGASHVVGGHHGGDVDRFPDAGRAFFDAIEEAAGRGLWTANGRPPEIELPLGSLDKEGVLRLAESLSVPLDLTWSCYEDARDPCGLCASCVERAGAFAALGAADPALAVLGA